MEILVKMRIKKGASKISYNAFCSWLGPSIEPTEGYYFRHDSKKNPQFEINLTKSTEKTAKN
jgi:hypothetical protein